MKIRTVRFREGREGDPIARWEGKVAFPDRRTPVTAGRLYRVLEARPNPKGTVYFLEVSHPTANAGGLKEPEADQP